MKFERTSTFDRDFRALKPEHQKTFRDAIPRFHAACERFISSGGTESWPQELRVKKLISVPGVWEMTWSFAAPDGRATFEFVETGEEIRVRWRRIGQHAIFTNP